MRQIIFSVLIIVSVFVLSAPAQSIAQQSFEKGIRAANSGKYETALDIFKASLAFAGEESTSEEFLSKIHFNIGVCLYRLERSREAVPELERSVKLSRGTYEKAFYALGMALTDLKNWPKAEEAFLAAVALNGKNGETWLDLAFVYLAEKNYEPARAAFQKAIEHKSVDASLAHNNLGVILALSGNMPAAVEEFEIAVRESSGKLTVAERNLRFCKQLVQNFNRNSLAKLEFGK